MADRSERLEVTTPPLGGVRERGTRPVFARHAASLLVVRQSSEGAEVLMGVRGAGHRFMPNRLVFPGGAVDRMDGTAAAAAEPSAALMAVLGRVARPRLARGIAMAAARELEEETGLSLGDAPGMPPRLDGLSYLCRAITPAESPIRFNARFLVVDASRATGEARDSHELQAVSFRPLSELASAGLMLVTQEVLLRLETWLALDPAAREARALSVFRERRWRTE